MTLIDVVVALADRLLKAKRLRDDNDRLRVEREQAYKRINKLALELEVERALAATKRSSGASGD